MGFYGFGPFPVFRDMRYVFGGCVRKMGALLPSTFYHAKLLSERNENPQIRFPITTYAYAFR